MKKETLARAKELEKDIQQMEFALSYYKRGQWSHWDINDRASSFHFEFCKNWSHRDPDMQDLPTWLNKPLMEVVERELERCKHELETLGSEQEEINMKPGDEIPDKTKDGIQASDIREDEWKLPKKKKRPKLPRDYGYNSPFSVDDINSGAVAWMYFAGKERKACNGKAIQAGMSPWDVFYKAGNMFVQPTGIHDNTDY